MDAEILSEALEAFSDKKTARKKGKHVRTLRGVRGVPDGEVARVLAAAWHEDPPSLPDDEGELCALFGTAHEDGLVAIGLLAALVPDHPEAALDIGFDWLERVDEVSTADALGWLVLGPAALASGRLDRLLRSGHRGTPVAVRRAVALAALAFTTEPIAGPAAAALRERLSSRQIRFLDGTRSDVLHRWLDAMHRDEAPPVRKALRRVLRAWTADAPDEVARWGDSIQGGLPKLLRAEIDRARRRAERGAPQ